MVRASALRCVRTRRGRRSSMPRSGPAPRRATGAAIAPEQRTADQLRPPPSAPSCAAGSTPARQSESCPRRCRPRRSPWPRPGGARSGCRSPRVGRRKGRVCSASKVCSPRNGLPSGTLPVREVSSAAPAPRAARRRRHSARPDHGAAQRSTTAASLALTPGAASVSSGASRLNELRQRARRQVPVWRIPRAQLEEQRAQRIHIERRVGSPRQISGGMRSGVPRSEPASVGGGRGSLEASTGPSAVGTETRVDPPARDTRTRDGGIRNRRCLCRRRSPGGRWHATVEELGEAEIEQLDLAVVGDDGVAWRCPGAAPRADAPPRARARRPTPSQDAPPWEGLSTSSRPFPWMNSVMRYGRPPQLADAIHREDVPVLEPRRRAGLEHEAVLGGWVGVDPADRAHGDVAIEALVVAPGRTSPMSPRPTSWMRRYSSRLRRRPPERGRSGPKRRPARRPRAVANQPWTYRTEGLAAVAARARRSSAPRRLAPKRSAATASPELTSRSR